MTTRTAGILLDQYRVAFRREVKQGRAGDRDALLSLERRISCT
ncbi:MAG: hypothetical protein U0797_15730 [Gemmataceae bacterium]